MRTDPEERVEDDEARAADLGDGGQPVLLEPALDRVRARVLVLVRRLDLRDVPRVGLARLGFGREAVVEERGEREVEVLRARE